MRIDEQTIWINAKLESVFAFATDQSKLQTWLPNLVSSVVVGGGPIKTGSKLAQVRRHGNKEMTGEVTVIFHDPPNEHGIECSIMGTTATFTFKFEPAKGGTLVTLKGTVQASGFARLLVGMTATMCKKCNTETLHNLKRQAETLVPAAV